MERSGSQKALLVLSIISIVIAALGLLGSILLIASSTLVSAVPASEASEILADTGMTQGEAGAVVGIVGFVLLFTCAIELILGILGVRAANDNQKIMPVWVLAIIEVVLSILSIGLQFGDGTIGANASSSVVSLLFAVLMFWLANNIKKEAGR